MPGGALLLALGQITTTRSRLDGWPAPAAASGLSAAAGSLVISTRTAQEAQVTARPLDDPSDVTPFWQVQAVFDPDGKGGDFAYTIGLHRRGLPELHLWARPSLGADPAWDWKFSCADRTRILNELGRLLVRGELSVGSTIRREYDGGLGAVEFRVDPPGDRDALEAFGVAPGAAVLPVRWSLRRAPEGTLADLTPAAREDAGRSWTQLVTGLDVNTVGPAGWHLPTRPSFEPGQQFGPLTPLVLARAAQIAQADTASLAQFLVSAAKVSHATSLTSPIACSRAVARPVGRDPALAALDESVEALVDHVTSAGRRWSAVLADFAGDGLGQDWRASQRVRLADNLRDLLRDATLACLSTQAVSDLAPTDLWLQGMGPWETSRRMSFAPLTDQWCAAPSVLAAVRRLLRRRRPTTLRMIAVLHDITRQFAARSTRPDYNELEMRLTGWAMTSAAACPPVTDLLTARQRGQVGRGRSIADAPPWLPGLQEWASCLTSALTHRQRLSAEDVRTFAHPVRAVLPGLEQLLNTPL